jgi:hypothetical protein
MHALQTLIYSHANTKKQLTKLMDEKPAFQLTPEVEAAFQALKEALCTAPNLAYPHPRQRFVVDSLECHRYWRCDVPRSGRTGASNSLLQ